MVTLEDKSECKSFTVEKEKVNDYVRSMPVSVRTLEKVSCQLGVTGMLPLITGRGPGDQGQAGAHVQGKRRQGCREGPALQGKKEKKKNSTVGQGHTWAPPNFQQGGQKSSFREGDYKKRLREGEYFQNSGYR